MGCIYRRKKKLEDGSLIETDYWIKYYRAGRCGRAPAARRKATPNGF